MSIGDAERILRGTKIFHWNHGPSTQVYAYTVILRQPDAHARILAIARNGQRAGQLYALCALRHLGAVEADGLAKRLASSNEEILVYDGIGRLARVRAMVEMIETNKTWVMLQDAGTAYR